MNYDYRIDIQAGTYYCITHFGMLKYRCKIFTGANPRFESNEIEVTRCEYMQSNRMRV